MDQNHELHLIKHPWALTPGHYTLLLQAGADCRWPCNVYETDQPLNVSGHTLVCGWETKQQRECYKCKLELYRPHALHALHLHTWDLQCWWSLPGQLCTWAECSWPAVAMTLTMMANQYTLFVTLVDLARYFEANWSGFFASTNWFTTLTSCVDV